MDFRTEIVFTETQGAVDEHSIDDHGKQIALNIFRVRGDPPADFRIDHLSLTSAALSDGQIRYSSILVLALPAR